MHCHNYLRCLHAYAAVSNGHCIQQIDTTMGTFTVELYYKHAPRTVENFLKLADKGYYDGTIFHRIIRDFSEHLSLAWCFGCELDARWKC